MWMPQEVIRKKRDGEILEREDIRKFVMGIADDSVSEGQAAAFAMATVLKGMNIDERAELTMAMRDSGDVMNWDLPGPVVDKHSTGGVGDLVSLVLGPILAACGCYVPMISGRGLGHTGGTLDKLESIPGYNIMPSNERFHEIVEQVGIAIIGQTGDLAPSDKRLYAIRDVTATVDSIDLITASILGKKLAEGLEALVMDVKVGNGAFMTDLDAAKELAESIVRVANKAGVKTQAQITDMNQPLARAAGNAVEIWETIRLLKGEVESERLLEVIISLAASTLEAAGLAEDLDKARLMAEEALQSGRAAEVFSKMVEALGGPADLLEKPEAYLPKAKLSQPVYAAQAGFVQAINARAVGMAVIALGGGRLRPQDDINHAVGLTQLAQLGEQVDAETPIAVIHAETEEQLAQVEKALLEAYVVGAESQPATPLVHQIIQ